jgi:hypothetical protein
MFYNIRKMENAPNADVSRYMELASKFILTLPYPIIIYYDPDDTDLVQKIKTTRQHLPTKLNPCALSSTYFFPYKQQLEELQRTYPIHNINLQKDTPLYILLNNNKFHFVEDAIRQNPYKSTHFIYMDFGINHVAQNLEQIHKWIAKPISNKIRQMCVNPYVESRNSDKDFFHNIYHHLAGGLFMGDAQHLMNYVQLFKQKFHQMCNEGWYQLDEAIMTIIHRENPHLFDLYYGDYAGIVCNVDHVVNCHDRVREIKKKIRQHPDNNPFLM